MLYLTLTLAITANIFSLVILFMVITQKKRPILYDITKKSRNRNRSPRVITRSEADEVIIEQINRNKRGWD